MAGKSSTAKAFVKHLQDTGVNVKLLKETTTRPKRESDYENPEYHFVTEEEYNKRKFLVSVDFVVSSGETWRYGIELQDFPEVGVIVSNMYAVDYLLSNPCLPKDLDITVVYLNVSEEEIARRSKGDRVSQKGDSVTERIKRDIDNYNNIYAKHEDYIYEVICDDLSIDAVVDYIYYVLRQDVLLSKETYKHLEYRNRNPPKKFSLLMLIASILITILLTFVTTTIVYDYMIKDVVVISPGYLEDCPLCGHEPELQPVNDSYYIECKFCGLKTKYYGSLQFLVNYWNNR